MHRWTKRTIIGLCSLPIAAALTGVVYERIATRNDLAATPPPGRLADIGGHKLHIWCTGSGEPTVILETGLGGSTADWALVQPRIAEFTRVCSYDRAGLGYSDAGPTPRTAGRMAHELAQLLDHGNIRGPIILVGASIGGLVVRVFASKHPERVAALVLVDASHEDQEVRVPRLASFVPLLSSTGVLRVLRVSFGVPPEALPPSAQPIARATRFRAAAYQSVAQQMIHLETSATEVRATRRRLIVPVVVVTAGLDADSTWQELQRDQVRLSEQGCQIIAEQSGHLIALSQPEAIVKPIRALVERARGQNEVHVCG